MSNEKDTEEKVVEPSPDLLEVIEESIEPVVTVTSPATSDATGPIKELNETINVLVKTLTSFNEFATRLTAEDLTNPDWVYSSTLASQTGNVDDRFVSTLQRPKGDWRQGVMHEGQLYGIVAPQVGARGNVISGSSARAAVRQAAGGVPNKIIQLPHSGIVMNVEGLPLGKIFEMENYIASSRVNLGMETLGGIFGNNSSLIAETILQYLIPRIVRHNVKDVDADDLFKLIRVTDLLILINGFSAATFHDSHPVSIPCHNLVGETEKELCSHVYRGNININRLYYVDNFKLSTKQRSVLANRTGSYTREEIEAYQSGFDFMSSVGRRKITESLYIELEVPTVETYLQYGNEWVSDVLNRAEKVFKDRKSENQLKEYMNNQANLQPVAQYSSWIKSIVIVNPDVEEQRITDPEDITSNLENLMSIDGLTEIILRAIIDFINECTIGIIGMPIPVCPSCNNPLDGHPKYPRLHPIDPISHFFTLARLKQ